MSLGHAGDGPTFIVVDGVKLQVTATDGGDLSSVGQLDKLKLDEPLADVADGEEAVRLLLAADDHGKAVAEAVKVLQVFERSHQSLRLIALAGEVLDQAG